jgi:hypothetical protein
MSDLRLGQRSLGSAVGLGTVLVVVACVSGEGNNGDDGGSAGVSTAARAGQGAGATGAVAGTLGSGGATGGTGGATGGTTGASGGTAGVGVSGGTGGTAGISGAGSSTGGASGTGATGGSGNSCTDTPPPNGETCENAVSYGWCGQAWMNGACSASCDLCSGSGGTGNAGGTGGSAGSGGGSGSGGNVAPPPDINGGAQAWASRYWDCCKPACGWSGNVRAGNAMPSCDEQNQELSSRDTKNACESGGSAYMCWDGAPWSAGDRLSYGFVAASGANYQCGRCFHIQFNGTGHNGNNAGVQSLNGKHMIVQVINNGGVAQDQFDLLIPGGGVGEFNACDTQWGSSDLGAQYGGFLTGCNGDQSCVRDKCNTVFGDKPDLLAGCEWFLGWYGGADNPNLTYERIACPAALTARSGLSDPG